MTLFGQTWAWLTDGSNWSGSDGMWQQLLQQLLLTFTALGIALAIGMPIALWLGHLGRGSFLAINIAGVGRAIPTFAVLALLVLWEPIGNDTLGPYGRAGLATLIALALFALPPIITNTYVGVDEVPRDIREAADGMGMSGWQKFRGVELPMALPLIMTGIRLSLVQIWATATIAALVAGPGLGNVIAAGFFNGDYPKGLGGAIVVAAVALLLELFAAVVQRSVGNSQRDTEGGTHEGTPGDPAQGSVASPHRDDDVDRAAGGGGLRG